ncbi:MAG: 4-(cytidine 5'-diphospho)-2-C-methyl-D-erythritol kinase [Bacteroidetes bacterium]|nr:4-(cytidine 5'-diphospho)-2-C-methyl-D-erythritol kinase [Bacteroidota bacterium]
MISFPNAKINLGLHVLGKREDGFHDIETVFYPVEWSDALEIVPDPDAKTNVQFRNTGIKIYSKDQQNLCIKAYHLLAASHDLPPVKMHLHKSIPVGAGLGGGSSDAAFVLMMLNKIFGLKLNDEQLQKFASSLGSDCAFFIRNKPCFASGKGDQLEEIRVDLKNYFIILVKPKVRVSTADAYRGVIPSKPAASLKELIRLPVSKWKDAVQNDFEKTIFEKFTIIKNIKAKMYKYGAVYASMSGSGSSVFGIFTEEKNLRHSFRNCQVWNGFLK